MAINKNKRVATKHIRDGIKANYSKKDYCEICGTDENLELHHYHTVSLLLKDYAKENGIPISTDQEVLDMRDGFYKKYWHELVEDTVTLCNHHHIKLHKIYSQEPALHTTDKQRKWVSSQAEKIAGTKPTINYEAGNESDLCNFMVSKVDLSNFKV